MWQWQNHLLSCLRSAWPLQAFSFTTWVNVVLCFGGYLYYQTFWVHIHTNPFFLVAWLQPKQWINFHYNSVLSPGTKTKPLSQMIFVLNISPGFELCKVVCKRSPFKPNLSAACPSKAVGHRNQWLPGQDDDLILCDVEFTFWRLSSLPIGTNAHSLERARGLKNHSFIPNTKYQKQCDESTFWRLSSLSSFILWKRISMTHWRKKYLLRQDDDFTFQRKCD